MPGVYTHTPYIYGNPAMSHLSTDNDKLLARVRRLRGQVEAIERAIETGKDCAAILQLVASVRGAMGGLTAELLEHHLHHHVTSPDDVADRARGADELNAVIRTYLR